MNRENENTENVELVITPVPTEPQSEGPIFQNAGGMGPIEPVPMPTYPGVPESANTPMSMQSYQAEFPVNIPTPETTTYDYSVPTGAPSYGVPNPVESFVSSPTYQVEQPINTEVQGNNSNFTTPYIENTSADPSFGTAYEAPVTQVSPSVELSSLNLGNIDDVSDGEDYEELEEYEEPIKTPEQLDLDKRNTSGIRFITIFGLIVLLFILLLPFLVTFI